MCAQGQALHYIGGWNFARLRKTGQAEADIVTANLLNISRTHAVLLRIVNDGQPGAPSAVLTDPERVLGNNAPAVLAFWRHLNRMNADDWAAVRNATSNTDDWLSAAKAVATVTGQTIKNTAVDVVWDAVAVACSNARTAAWDVGACSVTSWATNEIQVAEIMAERGQPLFFLRAFGFSTVASVLAAASA